MKGRTWFASYLLCGTALLIQGCSMFDVEELHFEIPRGTRVAIDEVPAELVTPGSLPEGTKAERLGDGGAYRLEYPDGTVKVVGPDGSIVGGVI